MAVDPRVAMLAQVAGGGGGQVPQKMGRYGPSAEYDPNMGNNMMPQGSDQLQLEQMQGGGGSGGMPMPQGGGGGGLQQLMQMAGPLLQGMGPNAKAQLGQAMQTPGVQQMIAQVIQNPQLMQQILGMAAGGGGGGGADPRAAMATAQAGDPRMQAIPGGGVPENRGAVGTGPGPSTDGDLAQMDVLARQMRGGTPMPRKGTDYVGGAADEQEGEPQSTEQELQMLQQMMNRAGT